MHERPRQRARSKGARCRKSSAMSEPPAALSDDEDEEDDAAVEGLPQRRRRATGGSKQGKRRSLGSQRVKAYNIPLPLCYQVVEGGFQKYKLPADKRVYQRRQFVYDEAHKDGAVRTERPAAPDLFPDFVKYDEKAKLTNMVTMEDEPNLLLKRRVEARIVRIACDHFIDDAMPATGPIVEALAKANAMIALVYGARGSTWTAKQLMAWAQPEVELKGDTLSHYRGACILSAQTREIQRLLSIILLSATEGTQKYEDIFSQPNRFVALGGTLGAAATLLSTVLREGIMEKASLGGRDTWVVRDNLHVIFQQHQATYGKNAGNSSTQNHKEGDSFTFRIFEKPMEVDEMEEFDMMCPDGTVHSIGLDHYGTFLSSLTESALITGLHLIEKTLAEKPRTYVNVSSKSKNKEGGGKPRLQKDARNMVAKLKETLMATSATELKKILRKAGVTHEGVSNKLEVCCATVTV